MPSQLTPSVAKLLQLFDGPLREVRFPGADGAALAAATEDVHAARIAVAQAEAALAAARLSFQEKDAHLAELAQRTLAYARVYAQGNAELYAELPDGGRSVVRARRRAADAAGSDQVQAASGPVETVRRGRPRKAQRGEAQSAE